MFVSASLLVTFITLTASLLAALQWVHNVADCSNESSQCLYRIQKWLYRHVVESFVGLDPDSLELEATVPYFSICSLSVIPEKNPEHHKIFPMYVRCELGKYCV